MLVATRRAGATGRMRAEAVWRGRGPVLTRHGLTPMQASGPQALAPGRHGLATRVERATTNLVSNPRGGGGSVTPWIIDGAGVAVTAFSDPTAPTGTAFRLAGHTGGVCRIYEPLEAAAPSLAQGTPFAVRFAARALNAAAEGVDVHTMLWETGGPSGNQVTASVTGVLTAAWQDFTFTGAIQQAGRTGFHVLLGAPYGFAIAGAEYGITNVQVEPTVESSSYVDGSLGEGYDWSGAAHASPSSRAATALSSTMGHPDQKGGAIAVWLRPSWGSGSLTARTILAADAAPVGGLRLRFDGVGSWTVEDGEDSVNVPAAHDPGDDIVIFAGWTPAALRIAIGIEASGMATRSGGISHPSRWYFGGEPAGGSEVDSVLGPVVWLPSWPSGQSRAILCRSGLVL